MLDRFLFFLEFILDYDFKCFTWSRQTIKKNFIYDLFFWNQLRNFYWLELLLINTT